jgi:MraZ protein
MFLVLNSVEKRDTIFYTQVSQEAAHTLGRVGMYDLDGVTEHPVDGKGRVSLPARHQKLLPDDLVIAREESGDFHWLKIYSPEGFAASIEDFFDGLGGYDASNEGHIFYRGEMFKNKEKISVDQAGRILIKENLREFAALDKKVLIMGMDDRVEIWNPEAREKYENQMKEQIGSKFNLTRRSL